MEYFQTAELDRKSKAHFAQLNDALYQGNAVQSHLTHCLANSVLKLEEFKGFGDSRHARIPRLSGYQWLNAADENRVNLV